MVSLTCLTTTQRSMCPLLANRDPDAKHIGPFVALRKLSTLYVVVMFTRGGLATLRSSNGPWTLIGETDGVTRGQIDTCCA